MPRHAGMDGQACRQGWRRTRKSCGRSMKWNEPAASRTWWIPMQRQASSSFMTVRRKAPQIAGTSVTTAKRWRQGKPSSRPTAPWTWPPPWGVDLLTEDQYRGLQALGTFDTKTSSWLQTPAPIRKLGGALFGDRRYDHVFIYHNGADSYYGARGFRASLRV